MASKFSHLPDISTTQPGRLIKYRVSEDRFSAEVLLPGLSYTDFDQKIGGKVRLWSLAKLYECVHVIAFSDGFAHSPERRRDGFMTFTVGQVLYLSPEVHWIRSYNRFGLKPERFSACVSQLGSTSYTTQVDWYDSSKKLGYLLSKQVSVNEKTRLPVANPEYTYTNIESHLDGIKTHSIERMDDPVVPIDAFSLPVRVLYSDCDENYHLNQATYLKWCSDAASEAASAGKLSCFKTHIELYPAKKLEMYYTGEAYLKDELSVKVWEMEDDRDCLLFVIQKEKNTIFHMKMSFHSTELEDNLSGFASKM